MIKDNHKGLPLPCPMMCRGNPLWLPCYIKLRSHSAKVGEPEKMVLGSHFGGFRFACLRQASLYPPYKEPFK
ncbi:hypothetical protein BGP_1324 [Beggiatoa sp. PS]|nr:hypothetical protein BGP_1324 [Beggiatoa sp. PS]